MKKNVNLFPISEAPAPRPGGKRQLAPGTEEEHSVSVQHSTARTRQLAAICERGGRGALHPRRYEPPILHRVPGLQTHCMHAIFVMTIT